MGVCQSKQVKQDTFNSDNWNYYLSPILSQCQILQNSKHKEHHTFLWRTKNVRSQREQAVYKKRQNQQSTHLLHIYETGRQDQHYYVITQEFIRLKECKLTYLQAVVAAFQSLRAFQILLKDYGAFIAKNDMIFITKEGTVKVWINQNLSINQPSYPNPRLSEEEFIQSVINQINNRIDNNPDMLSSSKGGQTHINNNLISGQKTISGTLKKLKKILATYRTKRIKFHSKVFQNQIEEYKGKGFYSNINAKSNMKLQRANSMMKNSQNKTLKFMVGEENQGDKYIKKYTLQKGQNPFSKQNSQIELSKSQDKNQNAIQKTEEESKNDSEFCYSKSYHNNCNPFQSGSQSHISNFSNLKSKSNLSSLNNEGVLSARLFSEVIHVESKLIILEEQRKNPEY